MRNKIFGAVGVVWGGAILAQAFLRGGPAGTGAYAAGQTAALLLGLLMLVAGGYYFMKGGANRPPAKRARSSRHSASTPAREQ